MNKKKIVIFTGAGMSAESGISTFRGSDNSLWDQYDVKDVATIDGWRRNRQLVLEFYNLRHNQMGDVKPNDGHIGLSDLQGEYDIQIITQNVDNLHERAGSEDVLHLHGELMKMRSCSTHKVYDWELGNDLTISSTCENGGQLRPHIVWFGEDVPEIKNAIEIVKEADIFVVIGTSLQVYPAASLINYVNTDSKIIIIDPNDIETGDIELTHIKECAVKGVELLRDYLN